MKNEGMAHLYLRVIETMTKEGRGNGGMEEIA